MRTSIGKGLGSGSRIAVAGTVVAGLAVLADLVLTTLDTGYVVRSYVVLGALVGLTIGAKFDAESLGWRWRPRPRWGYWFWTAVVLAGIVALALGATAWVMHVAGREVPIPTLEPAVLGDHLLHACVLAPLVEEGIYRFALCTACVGLLGPWRTVIVSGAVFAFLHVLYGNPGPENLVGGFLLAWAYLRSGSILVPIALHALGNLILALFGLGVWYWAG